MKYIKSCFYTMLLLRSVCTNTFFVHGQELSVQEVSKDRPQQKLQQEAPQEEPQVKLADQQNIITKSKLVSLNNSEHLLVFLQQNEKVYFSVQDPFGYVETNELSAKQKINLTLIHQIVSLQDTLTDEDRLMFEQVFIWNY